MPDYLIPTAWLLLLDADPPGPTEAPRDMPVATTRLGGRWRPRVV